jgi:hypothetical protein
VIRQHAAELVRAAGKVVPADPRNGLAGARHRVALHHPVRRRTAPGAPALPRPRGPRGLGQVSATVVPNALRALSTLTVAPVRHAGPPVACPAAATIWAITLRKSSRSAGTSAARRFHRRSVLSAGPAALVGGARAAGSASTAAAARRAAEHARCRPARRCTRRPPRPPLPAAPEQTIPRHARPAPAAGLWWPRTHRGAMTSSSRSPSFLY